MKRFLSLVLSLVMVMSLVTISAGAKDFTDDDKITYEEAVAVISEIGVVSGDKDGSFRPTDSLTRQAAAKIICNMILGPTTAVELHADTAPYRDVPANYEFAGYIAYCQSQKIISGYGDGTFRPTAPLTGYAFMKMLLGALGYDAEIEEYVDANWSINVAKQALGIGLNKGLEGDFNGIKPVTREEAALYAFNTLQADLVDYDQKVTATVGGTVVTVGNSQATSRQWSAASQKTKINNIREDDFIQFAEEHFRQLEKKTGEDAFMRPAYTWVFDKEEIGTFVDWDLMVAEYTDSVTGRDLYDLLGSALLNEEDMDLTYYVNGVEPVNGSDLPTWVDPDHDGTNNITKGNNTIRRNNQSDVGLTDRGVLTQVFVDKDVREEIVITSIDTWLAKASADYMEARENASIEVWGTQGKNPNQPYVVDVEDVPEVADVTEDTFYLVNISFKDVAVNGEIVELSEPEIIEDSAITKFSLDDAQGTNQVPTKVTAGGTEYKQAKRGNYDPTALDEYHESLLTDRKYNLFLDPYGNMIGIELNEGAKNYVFITGFDRPQSNLSIKTADAGAIFLDGTMETIKVNVSATDDNIEDVNNDPGYDAGGDYFLPWQYLTGKLNQDGFHALNRWFTYTKTDAGVYTLKPATRMLAYKNTAAETIKTDNLYLDDNVMYLPSAGTYKANPYNAVQSDNVAGPLNNAITDYLYTQVLNARAYGNDDSVYITVDTDDVDTYTGNGTISGVNGVYTGVQSVEIELDPTDIAADRPIDEAYIYAVYDSDNYIIGAVTVGEGKGGNATIAYVTGGVKSERIEDGFYYWEFDAIVDGEEKTLTVKEKYDKVLGNNANKSTVNNEAAETYKDVVKGKVPVVNTPNSGRNWNAYDGLIELRMDADNYVVSVKSVQEKDIYSYFGDKYAATPSNFKGGNSIVANASDATFNTTAPTMDGIGDAKAYRVGVIQDYFLAGGDVAWQNATDGDGYYHHYDSAPEVLTVVGRTLYVTGDKTLDSDLYTNDTPSDEGLAMASDVKAFVIQRENGKWKTRNFSSINGAVSQVVDADNNSQNGKQFNGEVIAIMNGRAQASTVIIISYTDMVSGGNSYRVPLTAIATVADATGSPDSWDASGDDVDGDLSFTLVGTNAGQRYAVNLETWNDYQGRWDVIDTTNVPGASGVTNTPVSWYSGTLNSGHRYRLRCGDIVSVIHVCA